MFVFPFKAPLQCPLNHQPPDISFAQFDPVLALSLSLVEKGVAVWMPRESPGNAKINFTSLEIDINLA